MTSGDKLRHDFPPMHVQVMPGFMRKKVQNWDLKEFRVKLQKNTAVWGIWHILFVFITHIYIYIFPSALTLEVLATIKKMVIPFG